VKAHDVPTATNKSGWNSEWDARFTTTIDRKIEEYRSRVTEQTQRVSVDEAPPVDPDAALLDQLAPDVKKAKKVHINTKLRSCTHVIAINCAQTFKRCATAATIVQQ
jgi:hypothetical protein